ncbi:MAG: ribosome silencing factor [Clostridia bacterium]|nr:ribosome silencing factor [Clostridia bacterium]
MENIFEIKQGELFSANAKEIVSAVVKILDSKKAGDIKVLKIDNKTIIADYFVICSGNSSTQIRTLADEVEFQLSRGSVPYVKLEGTDSIEWKVVDCHDVIVHIFSNDARNFYNLEKLWADAEEINIDDIISEEGK